MPSHFHCIINVNPKYGAISDIMRDLKKHSSKEITKYLSDNKILQDIFEQEAIKRGRIANPTSNDSESGVCVRKYKKLWMDRFDDKVIRDQKMLLSTIRYIHNNPVDAGIVKSPDDYIYSSARNYLRNDHSILEVDTEWAGVESLA